MSNTIAIPVSIPVHADGTTPSIDIDLSHSAVFIDTRVTENGDFALTVPLQWSRLVDAIPHTQTSGALVITASLSGTVLTITYSLPGSAGGPVHLTLLFNGV